LTMQAIMTVGQGVIQSSIDMYNPTVVQLSNLADRAGSIWNHITFFSGRAPRAAPSPAGSEPPFSTLSSTVLQEIFQSGDRLFGLHSGAPLNALATKTLEFKAQLSASDAPIVPLLLGSLDRIARYAANTTKCGMELDTKVILAGAMGSGFDHWVENGDAPKSKSERHFVAIASLEQVIQPLIMHGIVCDHFTSQLQEEVLYFLEVLSDQERRYPSRPPYTFRRLYRALGGNDQAAWETEETAPIIVTLKQHCLALNTAVDKAKSVAPLSVLRDLLALPGLVAATEHGDFADVSLYLPAQVRTYMVTTAYHRLIRTATSNH